MIIKLTMTFMKDVFALKSDEMTWRRASCVIIRTIRMKIKPKKHIFMLDSLKKLKMIFGARILVDTKRTDIRDIFFILSYILISEIDA